MIKFFILLLPLLLLGDTGTLKKIVDGDTVHFKTNNQIVKCRIQHIDTPETSNNKKNKSDLKHCNGVTEKDMTSMGKSATRAAKRLLTIDKEYEYDVNGKDRYQRSICIIKLGNSTFNEQMVLNGYAIPYRQFMNTSEKRHYNALLEKAKSTHSGLWKERADAIECLNEARK